MGRIKIDLAKIIGGCFALIAAVLFVIHFYGYTQNPELTQMQYFIEHWRREVAILICGTLAVIFLNSEIVVTLEKRR